MASTDDIQTTEQEIAVAGLPALTGSPEQVTQATSIRTLVLVDADDILTRLRSNQILTGEQKDTAVHAPQQVGPAEVGVAQRALGRLRAQTEAAWWIAHGGAGAQKLLDDLSREV